MGTAIERLRARLEGASPGPWETRGPASDNDMNLHIYAESGDWVANVRPWSLMKRAAAQQAENALLIVEAVNSLPKLIAIVEAAEEMLALFEMDDEAQTPGTDSFIVRHILEDAFRELETSR